MDKELFDALLESTAEAKEILQKKRKASRTFYIEEPDAKAIRTQLKLTQNEFAALLNISVNTLRNWEQGRRVPEGPAKVLLHVAKEYPDVLLKLGA